MTRTRTLASRGRLPAVIVALVLLLLAISPSRALAYLNLSPDGVDKSTRGPHQAINRCAYRTWVEWQLGKGDFKLYRLPSPALQRRVEGRTFTVPGNFYPDVQEGFKHFTWGEWLQEGGYTADEPEIWQALRHFYDPTKASRPYLSDPHAGLNSTAWYWGTKIYAHPQMDAITWAVEGPARNDQPPNEFSWEKAREYMESAWHETRSAQSKDRWFGQGWRAVGETMHLVADMTVPAHVRNDGHAGKLPVGSLGVEPLEKRTTDERVMGIYYNCVQGRTLCYAALRDRTGTDVYYEVEQSRNPRELMHRVATWTNKNFFSQDTVVGTLPVAGTRKTIYVSPVNGMDYPAPRLEDCKPDNDFGVDAATTAFTRNIKVGIGGNPREVYMGRLSWTREWFGWGATKARKGAEIMDDMVIESQGHALVPTAIFACVQVIDYAMPRAQVRIDAFDQATRKFTGRVTHKPQGLYTRELRYSLPSVSDEWGRFVSLRLGSAEIKSPSFSMTITDGKIEGQFASALEIDGKDLVLAVDVGGFMVESPPFRIGDGGLNLKTWEQKSRGSLLERFTYYDVPRKMPANWGTGVHEVGRGVFHGNATESRWIAGMIASSHGDKVLHGKYQRWYEGRGELVIEAEYTYGILNGPVRLYNSSGSDKVKAGLHIDGAYKNGLPDGDWNERDFSGEISRIHTFSEGKITREQTPKRK